MWKSLFASFFDQARYTFLKFSKPVSVKSIFRNISDQKFPPKWEGERGDGFLVENFFNKLWQDVVAIFKIFLFCVGKEDSHQTILIWSWGRQRSHIMTNTCHFKNFLGCTFYLKSFWGVHFIWKLFGVYIFIWKLASEKNLHQTILIWSRGGRVDFGEWLEAQRSRPRDSSISHLIPRNNFFFRVISFSESFLFRNNFFFRIFPF